MGMVEDPVSVGGAVDRVDEAELVKALVAEDRTLDMGGPEDPELNEELADELSDAELEAPGASSNMFCA